MNREIKFRVWDSKNKHFINDIPINEEMLDPQPNCPTCGQYLPMFSDGGIQSIFFIKANDPFFYFGGRLIYQQFTGLKDKNNKEIYEGDILENIEFSKQQAKERECNKYFERSIVEYYPELARFGLEFYSEEGGEGCTDKEQHISDFAKSGCVVIGNIFENPELLK